MVIGETLIAGTTAFSPWFEATGGGATFAVEVLGLLAEGDEDPDNPSQLVIDVQTKRLEEADSQAETLATESGSPWTANAVGTQAAYFTGFRELLRFRYDVQIGNLSSFAVHFRMLPPAWQCNALGCSVEAQLRKESELHI